MISIRRTAPVLAVSVVALAMAGCASKDSDTPTVEPTGVPSSTSSATPTAAPTTPPATATPQVAKAGCPVDTSTLEAAFKANRELADAIILGSGLTDITCYMDYATARTNPVNMDRAMVLFAYDPGAGTWKAVSGGTDLDCRQAPTAVISHLPGCHNQ
jgi:hypothetical protein